MDAFDSPLSPGTIHDPGPKEAAALEDRPNQRYDSHPHPPGYNPTWQDGRLITVENAVENPKAVAKAIQQYYIKTECLLREFPQGYMPPADSPNLSAPVQQDISKLPVIRWDGKKNGRGWCSPSPLCKDKTFRNPAEVARMQEEVYNNAIQSGSFDTIATYWHKESKPLLPLAEWYIEAKDYRPVVESTLLPDLDPAERSEDVNNSQAPLNKLGLCSTLRLLSISPATRVAGGLWSMRSMDPVGFLAVSLNDALVEANIPGTYCYTCLLLEKLKSM